MGKKSQIAANKLKLLQSIIISVVLLPTFASPEQADWDQFTLYIYMNFVSPRNEAKYENFNDVLFIP